MQTSSPPPAPQRLMVCVVTHARNDVSLMCAMSMLRMQTLLMSSQQPVRCDMAFVPTFNDAINALYANPDAVGSFIVDHSMGFDAQFPMEAINSGLPLVVASYPLPSVDWDRVKTQPANEQPQHWGNVYNIKPTGNKGPNGYVEVSDAKLGVCFVTSEAVQQIARRHPEILTKDRKLGAFATEGVYGDTYHDAHSRFLGLWDKKVWADVERAATSSGPAEFGGCVGMRNVLR